MTADPRARLDSLSCVVRRLAAAYREAATWQQLAVLAPPLAVCALAQTPLAWAGAALVLGILFYLRLDLGLRMILLALPFAFVYKHVGADIYSPVEILTVACFLAWTAQRIGPFIRRLADSPIRRAADLPIRRFAALRGLDWAVLFFIAAAFLSLAVAEDKGAARWELRILIIEPALVYAMVRTLLWPREQAQATGLRYGQRVGAGTGEKLLPLADALAAAGLILAFVGLYQYFFTDYVESVQGVRRILSLYDSPNHVSLFLGRIVPISFSLAAFGAMRWRRLYHAAALLPLLLCIYFTYSRGAWLLGLPAGLIFIAALRGRRGRILAAGALIAALGALAPILRTPRMASLLTLEGGTNFLRLVLWTGAARMIAAHPIFGVGLGNFVSQYPRYMLPEGGYEPVVYHPHNLLLDVWTSMGVPGLIALACLLVAFFRAGLDAYRRLAAERDLQALILGLLASMVGFLAHGLVDTGFRLTDLAFVFMWTLGMLAAGDTDRPQRLRI
jgi:O-antigen ligase